MPMKAFRIFARHEPWIAAASFVDPRQRNTKTENSANKFARGLKGLPTAFIVSLLIIVFRPLLLFHATRFRLGVRQAFGVDSVFIYERRIENLSFLSGGIFIFLIRGHAA